MLGIIGGTGPEGCGLAVRFAATGHSVLVGSRDIQRANAVVTKLSTIAPGLELRGVMNQEAAKASDIVLVTVPYEAQRSTLEPLRADLKGKLVVEVVAPLTFENGKARAMPVPDGCAAVEAQNLLPDSKVVAAFQNISATDLLALNTPIDGDVIVCSDHAEAKTRVMALAQQIKGVRAVDGGPLDNARYVEELTALLLNINGIYKARSMVRITGI